MALAIVTDGNPVELPYGQDLRSGGYKRSYATLTIWTEEERNEIGVHTIVEPGPAPEGQTVLSAVLAFDGETVTRVPTYG